jgi:uncharacterized peroxidase-related enzyme
MFLEPPPDSEARSAMYARDVADDGYVANVTQLWAWRPDVFDAFLTARKLLTEKSELSLRERAILVCAMAANVGDSYCALAWGTTLASETDPTTAASVVRCEEATELTSRERALATWAGEVVRQPNGITAEDVDRLRAAGLTDQEIFDVTVFVAFRLAFSTVNDALGARPDWQLAEAAPAAVRDAVGYGRAVSERATKYCP